MLKSTVRAYVEILVHLGLIGVAVAVAVASIVPTAEVERALQTPAHE